MKRTNELLHSMILVVAVLAVAGCGDAGSGGSALPPDPEFRMIEPVGPIEYEGEVLYPTCLKGTPYRFFAKRGSVNKLMIHYQGGGACWDATTCSVPSCTPTADPGDNPNDVGGFFDADNPANPFRDWHMIMVTYCSCDIHFGDAAQSYAGGVEHRGYQNARVVEKYARETFPDPEEILLNGTSAGAYGAFFHAPFLRRAFPRARLYAVADAGNGVVTEKFLREDLPNWNFEAHLPSDIPGLREAFFGGEGLVGYTSIVTKAFPDIRWAHYSSAYDGGIGGQSSFYNVMLKDSIAGAVTWWEASCEFNAQMRAQVIRSAEDSPSNYRYFIGTGAQHGMWFSNKVYTDTSGGVPLLVDWVSAMVDGGPGWSNVECSDCGVLPPGDPKPEPLRPPFAQAGDAVVVTCPEP